MAVLVAEATLESFKIQQEKTGNFFVLQFKTKDLTLEQTKSFLDEFCTRSSEQVDMFEQPSTWRPSVCLDFMASWEKMEFAQEKPINLEFEDMELTGKCKKVAVLPSAAGYYYLKLQIWKSPEKEGDMELAFFVQEKGEDAGSGKIMKVARRLEIKTCSSLGG